MYVKYMPSVYFNRAAKGWLCCCAMTKNVIIIVTMTTTIALVFDPGDYAVDVAMTMAVVAVVAGMVDNVQRCDDNTIVEDKEGSSLQKYGQAQLSPETMVDKLCI